MSNNEKKNNVLNMIKEGAENSPTKSMRDYYQSVLISYYSKKTSNRKSSNGCQNGSYNNPSTCQNYSQYSSSYGPPSSSYGPPSSSYGTAYGSFGTPAHPGAI
jgi:hypothetical protein